MQHRKGLSPIKDLISDNDLFVRFQNAWDGEPISRSPSPRFPSRSYRSYSGSSSPKKSWKRASPRKWRRRKRLRSSRAPSFRKARRFTRLQRSPSVHTLKSLGLDPLQGEHFEGDHPQKPYRFNSLPRPILRKRKLYSSTKATRFSPPNSPAQIVKSEDSVLPDVGIHPAWLKRAEPEVEPKPILENVKQVYISETSEKRSTSVLYDPFEDTSGIERESWFLEKIHIMSPEEVKRRKKSEKRWARRTKKRTMRALEKAEKEKKEAEQKQKEEEERKKMELELKEIEKAREANEREFEETIDSERKEKRLRAEAEEFDEPYEPKEPEVGENAEMCEEKRQKEHLERREETRKVDAERQLAAEAQERAELARREELRIRKLEEMQQEKQLQQQLLLAERERAEASRRQKERRRAAKAEYLKHKAEIMKARNQQQNHVQSPSVLKPPQKHETQEERFQRRLMLHQQAHDAQLKQEKIRRENNLKKKARNREMKLLKKNERQRVIYEFKPIAQPSASETDINQAKSHEKPTHAKRDDPINLTTSDTTSFIGDVNILEESISEEEKLSDNLDDEKLYNILTPEESAANSGVPVLSVFDQSLSHVKAPYKKAEDASLDMQPQINEKKIDKKARLLLEDMNSVDSMRKGNTSEPGLSPEVLMYQEPVPEVSEKGVDEPLQELMLEAEVEKSDIPTVRTHALEEMVDHTLAGLSQSSNVTDVDATEEVNLEQRTRRKKKRRKKQTDSVSNELDHTTESSTVQSPSEVCEEVNLPPSMNLTSSEVSNQAVESQQRMQDVSEAESISIRIGMNDSHDPMISANPIGIPFSTPNIVSNINEEFDLNASPTMKLQRGSQKSESTLIEKTASLNEVPLALKTLRRKKSILRKKSDLEEEEIQPRVTVKEELIEIEAIKLVHASGLGELAKKKLGRRAEDQESGIKGAGITNEETVEELVEGLDEISRDDSEDNTKDHPIESRPAVLEDSKPAMAVKAKELEIGEELSKENDLLEEVSIADSEVGEIVTKKKRKRRRRKRKKKSQNLESEHGDENDRVEPAPIGDKIEDCIEEVKPGPLDPALLKNDEISEEKLNETDNLVHGFDKEVYKNDESDQIEVEVTMDEEDGNDFSDVKAVEAVKKKKRRRRRRKKSKKQKQDLDVDSENLEEVVIEMGDRNQEKNVEKKMISSVDEQKMREVEAVKFSGGEEEMEITMADLDSYEEQALVGNADCVEDFSLEFLMKAQREIAKDKGRKQNPVTVKESIQKDRMPFDLKNTKGVIKISDSYDQREISEDTEVKQKRRKQRVRNEIIQKQNEIKEDDERGMIKINDPYDRTNVRFSHKPAPEIPVQGIEKQEVSAKERRENIRSVWDRLTEKAKEKSEFDKTKYRYPYKVVHGTTDDIDEDAVLSKDELFDLVLKEAYGRGASHGTTFLLSKKGFQELADPVDFPTIDDRKIDPKYQKTKQDIKLALHLYHSKPSNKLESDLVANLEMLEIFDPFLADKMKFHHPELGEIKDKVYEREKEPTEWNMWQLCNWLRKERFSKWVIKKFEANDINGKTIHWFTKNRKQMAEQLDLDLDIVDEICDEIEIHTKEKRRRSRRFRRSPMIVDFIRRTLPQLSQKKVLFYSKYLGAHGVWQLEDLTKQVIWDKLDEIRPSHLVPLIQAAIRKLDDTPEELEFKLKHLRIEDDDGIDNASVATGQSMSPGMLVSRRLLAEQWIANKFPELWNKYPERGGKLGYVIVELKDTDQITKKQHRALNVLRYGGAIGAHYSPLSEYQTGQKGHMKAESDRSLKKLGLLDKNQSIDEERLLLQSNNAMNSLGLTDLDLVTHMDQNDSSDDEEDEKYLVDGLALQCSKKPKQVRFSNIQTSV